MRAAGALVRLFFAGAVVLAASPARAQLPPRTFRLEVQRGEGADCPAAEGVRDAITVAAGVDPVDAKSSARLRVELLQGGAIARGRWAMFDAGGALLRERTVTITGPCKKLLAELVMTWVVFYETPPAAAPAPACDEVCREQVKRELREEVRRELVAAGYVRRMNPSVAVLTGVLMSAGYAADPQPGLFFSGEVHGDVLSLGLELHGLFSARAVREPDKKEFSIAAITGTAVPCARWKPGGKDVALLGCAFFDLGAVLAGGGARSPAGPLATMGVGPRLAVHVPFADRFALRVFADLRFAPVATSATFAGAPAGTKWESNVVSGLFGLGVSFE